MYLCGDRALCAMGTQRAATVRYWIVYADDDDVDVDDDDDACVSKHDGGHLSDRTISTACTHFYELELICKEYIETQC